MIRVLSIALLVLGAVLFGYGSYMSSEAAFAEGKISQAEATGQRRPTLGPIRRAVRAQQAESKQEMLSQEGQKMTAAKVTANWLRGTGAVLFILGIGILFFSRKRGQPL